MSKVLRYALRFARSPAEFGGWIGAEHGRYAKIVREANLQRQ